MTCSFGPSLVERKGHGKADRLPNVLRLLGRHTTAGFDARLLLDLIFVFISIVQLLRSK